MFKNIFILGQDEDQSNLLNIQEKNQKSRTGRVTKVKTAIRKKRAATSQGVEVKKSAKKRN